MAEDTPQRTDFEHALQSMATYLDVSADDLMTLYARARQFARQRRTETRRIDTVMSRDPQTVTEDTPLAEAAHRLLTHRISGLPVVDARGILCGVLTEADFLRALGVPAHPPTHSLWQTLESLLSHLDAPDGFDDPDSPVSVHMTREVVCVAADRDLHAALALMKKHRVKRLVVCDAGQRPIGMLTRSDLVRVFFERYAPTGRGPDA